MTWLAWRQHRVQLAAGLGTLVAIAIFLVLSGKGMYDAFDAMGLNQCAAPTEQSCAELSHRFQQQYAGYQFLIPLFLILPAAVGIFWGAPLVAREVEQGTHRLAWTQSITRRRWLTMKVALMAAATVIGYAVLSWVLQWWIAPIMSVRSQRFDQGIFDLLGLVPTAYAVGALAIGIAAGTVTRKVVPAIGLTLVAFMVVRSGVEFGLRPHYMEPVTTSLSFASDERGFEFPVLPEGWVMSAQTFDKDGRVISDGVGIELESAQGSCPDLSDTPRAPGPGAGPRALESCAQRAGFHVVAVYQPQDRYWRFQAIEAAIFVAMSVGLVAGSAWWLRRRVT